MLEQTRLNYLQAMGITPWIPRKALPHAPAPRWLADEGLPAVAANEEAGLEALFAEHGLASPPTPTADIPAPIEQAVAPETISTIAPEAGVTPHFQLFFISSSLPVIWVCDNVSELEALQRFIHNVQIAMQGKAEFVAQAFEFRWPYLPHSQQQDQTTPVALHALQAHWRFMQSTNQAQRAVVFGTISQQWLAQLKVPTQFYAPSVMECLTTPELKRQLWHGLLHLNT